jgi:hypothetical protein
MVSCYLLKALNELYGELRPFEDVGGIECAYHRSSIRG